MIQLLEHFTYKKLIRFTIPTVAMMIFTSVFTGLLTDCSYQMLRAVSLLRELI